MIKRNYADPVDLDLEFNLGRERSLRFITCHYGTNKVIFGFGLLMNWLWADLY